MKKSKMIRAYKIHITVLTSAHIGSGETIPKYAYIYDKESGYFKIINQKKLTELLVERNVFDEYLGLISGLPKKGKNKESSLYDFLDERGLAQDDIIQSFTQYTVKNENPQDFKLFYNIKLFIKDSDNRPYIPGSSIKGMLIGAISSDSDSADNIKAISRAISIADSAPISLDNLMINKVYRFNYKIRKDSSLNEYAEFLRPNTQICAIMKLDESVISIKELKAHLERVYNDYFQLYLSKFADLDNIYIPTITPKAYLGAFTGYPTKTIVYPKYKENAPKKAPDYLARILNKKPLKCTKLNNRLQENGAIQIQFEEIPMEKTKNEIRT
jgi:CRISPR-associated protein Csm5